MPPKTNILYLITEFDTGGAENMLLRLASGINKNKFNVSACCLTGRGEIGEKLSRAGVKVYYLDMKGKLDFAAFVRLIKLLKKTRPDILHSFLFHANFMGRIAGRISRVPAIVSSVRVSEKQQPLHIIGERLTHPLADRILCVSKAVMEFMAGNGIPRGKMRVIPNGVDLNKFKVKYDSAEVKKELGIPANAKVVGTVSRLTLQKRIDRFLDCAKIILEKMPGVFFVVAGKGELENELKSYAEKIGISEKVRFLGFRHDVQRVLSVFDVFMLTSSWEGMPVSLLEAMAMGRPAVVSDVEGSSEIVVDGKNGFLARGGDPDVFARLALRLLENPETAKAVGEKAVERAGDYSADMMVKRNEDLYSDLFLTGSSLNFLDRQEPL